MPITGKSSIGIDFIAHLRDIYSVIPKDDTERYMTEIHTLIEFCFDRRNSLQKILDRLAKTMSKMFEFRSVSIGMKSDDGLYRYVTMVGHSKESEDALRKLKYTLPDMIEYDKYPSVRIGLISQYHPVEAFPGDNPDEFLAHNKPPLLDRPRTNLNEFKPGDYIDIYMHGYEGELIGWIELSVTKNNKMPARSSVKWIELLADVCAGPIQQRMRLERELRTKEKPQL